MSFMQDPWPDMMAVKDEVRRAICTFFGIPRWWRAILPPVVASTTRGIRLRCSNATRRENRSRTTTRRSRGCQATLDLLSGINPFHKHSCDCRP
ncbi:MAG: hypothetical protein GX307_08745 [Euryarchaeota archaeon]|nr:hypothetical protein [Euryarchaeota archaeon]